MQIKEVSIQGIMTRQSSRESETGVPVLHEITDTLNKKILELDAQIIFNSDPD